MSTLADRPGGRSHSDLPKAIEWIGGLDGCVRIIDQTRLPEKLVFLDCRSAEIVREAIVQLRVRGAPAIGIAGAMGAVLGVRDYAGSDRGGFVRFLERVCATLNFARPTGVNLSWALRRMRECVATLPEAPIPALKEALLGEARNIRDEDAAMCRAIGEAGLPLITPGIGVMTHCNAGALATSELGTALAPLYLAHRAGRPFRVYARETRPLLQGSRLTAWELSRAGIDVTLLCDNAAGVLMKQGRVNLIITGADRIAANGDTANKIGTYELAVLARAHGIPFYVAAPSSTFDPAAEAGGDIPIEERSPDEVRRGFGVLTAPPDVPCFTPAFDVTPAELLTGLITERGIIEPVTREAIARTMAIKPPVRDTRFGR